MTMETNRRGFLKLLGLTGAVTLIPPKFMSEVLEVVDTLPEPDEVKTSMRFTLGDRVYNIGDALQIRYDSGESYFNHLTVGSPFGYKPTFLGANPSLEVDALLDDQSAREIFMIMDRVMNTPTNIPGYYESAFGFLEGELRVDGRELITFRLDNAMLQEYSDVELSGPMRTSRLTFKPMQIVGFKQQTSLIVNNQKKLLT